MARRNNDDLLMDDDLTAQFFDEPDLPEQKDEQPNITDDNQNEIEEEELPGQLAIDCYETEDSLVIKARTAGVTKDNIDVSVSEGILTISGTLSSGDDVDAINWLAQECYWGEFTRTFSLTDVPVKEDEAKASLKDGILTITFPKVEQQKPTSVPFVD